MKIELTDQEGQIAITLIDMAVKAGGLQVAEAATVLFKKIQDASKVIEVKQD